MQFLGAREATTLNPYRPSFRHTVTTLDPAITIEQLISGTGRFPATISSSWRLLRERGGLVLFWLIGALKGNRGLTCLGATWGLVVGFSRIIQGSTLVRKRLEQLGAGFVIGCLVVDYQKVVVAGSIDEAFELLNPRNSLWDDGHWIFRGQGDSQWRLVPSAFRDDWYPRKVIAAAGKRLSVRAQALIEWRALKDFLLQVNEGGLRFASGNEGVISTKALEGTMGEFMEKYSRDVCNPRVWPHVDLLPNLALAQHQGCSKFHFRYRTTAHTGRSFVTG